MPRDSVDTESPFALSEVEVRAADGALKACPSTALRTNGAWEVRDAA
jgi:hypothetical protein